MQLRNWTCTIFGLLTLSCPQRRAIEYSAVAGNQRNGVSHISGYCLLGKMSDDMPANDKITAHQDNEFMKCRSFHCSKLDDRHLYLFQWGLFMYRVRRIWNWVAPWTRHRAAFSGWIPPWCRSWCCPSTPPRPPPPPHQPDLRQQSFPSVSLPDRCYIDNNPDFDYDRWWWW